MRVNKLTEGNELFCHYRNQTSPQPCYIELDCEGETLTADYNGEIGNAVPFAVWHRRTLRFDIPILTADAANRLLDEIAPLAQRVIGGYESVWDGSNHVGTYTDDAQRAIEEIENLCDDLDFDSENDTIQYWDVADWLNDPDWIKEFGLTAETGNARVHEIAEQIISDAKSEGVLLDGDVAEYILNIRDDLETE